MPQCIRKMQLGCNSTLRHMQQRHAFEDLIVSHPGIILLTISLRGSKHHVYHSVHDDEDEDGEEDDDVD